MFMRTLICVGYFISALAVHTHVRHLKNHPHHAATQLPTITNSSLPSTTLKHTSAHAPASSHQPAKAFRASLAAGRIRKPFHSLAFPLRSADWLLDWVAPPKHSARRKKVMEHRNTAVMPIEINFDLELSGAPYHFSLQKNLNLFGGRNLALNVTWLDPKKNTNYLGYATDKNRAHRVGLTVFSDGLYGTVHLDEEALDISPLPKQLHRRLAMDLPELTHLVKHHKKGLPMSSESSNSDYGGFQFQQRGNRWGSGGGRPGPPPPQHRPPPPPPHHRPPPPPPHHRPPPPPPPPPPHRPPPPPPPPPHHRPPPPPPPPPPHRPPPPPPPPPHRPPPSPPPPPAPAPPPPPHGRPLPPPHDPRPIDGPPRPPSRNHHEERRQRPPDRDHDNGPPRYGNRPPNAGWRFRPPKKYVLIKAFFDVDMEPIFRREKVELLDVPFNAKLRTPDLLFAHLYNIAQSYIDELLKPDTVILVLKALAHDREKSVHRLNKGSLGQVLEFACKSKAGSSDFFSHNKWHEGYLYQVFAGGLSRSVTNERRIEKRETADEKLSHKNRSSLQQFDGRKRRIGGSRIRTGPSDFRHRLKNSDEEGDGHTRKPWKGTYRTKKPRRSTKPISTTHEGSIWEVHHTVLTTTTATTTTRPTTRTTKKTAISVAATVKNNLTSTTRHGGGLAPMKVLTTAKPTGGIVKTNNTNIVTPSSVVKLNGTVPSNATTKGLVSATNTTKSSTGSNSSSTTKSLIMTVRPAVNQSVTAVTHLANMYHSGATTAKHHYPPSIVSNTATVTSNLLGIALTVKMPAIRADSDYQATGPPEKSVVRTEPATVPAVGARHGYHTVGSPGSPPKNGETTPVPAIGARHGYQTPAPPNNAVTSVTRYRGSEHQTASTIHPPKSVYGHPYQNNPTESPAVPATVKPTHNKLHPYGSETADTPLSTLPPIKPPLGSELHHQQKGKPNPYGVPPVDEKLPPIHIQPPATPKSAPGKKINPYGSGNAPVEHTVAPTGKKPTGINPYGSAGQPEVERPQPQPPQTAHKPNRWRNKAHSPYGAVKTPYSVDATVRPVPQVVPEPPVVPATSTKPTTTTTTTMKPPTTTTSTTTTTTTAAPTTTTTTSTTTTTTTTLKPWVQDPNHPVSEHRLGATYIGGYCKAKEYRCSILYATSVTKNYIAMQIAHEIMNSIGIRDDEDSPHCRDPGRLHQVMSHAVIANPPENDRIKPSWSPCARAQAERIFEQESSCFAAPAFELRESMLRQYHARFGSDLAALCTLTGPNGEKPSGGPPGVQGCGFGELNCERARGIGARALPVTYNYKLPYGTFCSERDPGYCEDGVCIPRPT